MSLDKAIYHTKELKKSSRNPSTVTRLRWLLLSKTSLIPPVEAEPGFISRQLPDDWPFWYNPDYREVEKEIKANPRWEEWVKNTKD